jgi:pimeloyl-ACP methyl ester carboxylesterase
VKLADSISKAPFKAVGKAGGKVASFQSDGVEIAYEVVGEGAPVLLIHGFASNARVNWRDTLWVKTLVGAGHRVIAHDNRGHGQSEKLYDPADYGAENMAEDARRLLDHLEIAKADVIGYSMGARLTALLAIAHPDRVRRAVLGGLAANMIRGLAGSETIARALEADDPAAITDPAARGFRAFAEQTNSDLAGARRLHARVAPGGVGGGAGRHRLPGPGGGGRRRRDRRAGRAAGGRDPPCPRPRPARPRSHEGGRRPALQAGGRGISG